MASSDGDFVDYLKRLGRQHAAGLGDHPEPETLLAYHRGELDEAAAEVVEEHVTFCASCADLVLAIPAFLEESEEGAEAEGVVTGGGSADTEVGRDSGAMAVEAAVLPFPSVARSRQRSWLPLAAGLLVGLGTGYLVGRGGPVEIGPSFRVAVEEGRTGARGEAGEPLELDFRGGRLSAVVVLTPEGTVGAGPFRGRVTTGAGRVLLEEIGLEPTASGTFLLVVPRGTWPPGELTAEIFSELDGASVGRWTLRVLVDP
ncbi:MAG: hypothetical protein SF066_09170 [Thermoanaerobaculia bacterium]|nr:hypothetical protein [Thermoanaerobaculia bacterium]